MIIILSNVVKYAIVDYCIWFDIVFIFVSLLYNKLSVVKGQPFALIKRSFLCNKVGIKITKS